MGLCVRADDLEETSMNNPAELYSVEKQTEKPG